MTSFAQRVEGGLFGAALGDALAAPVEFATMARIMREYPTPNRLDLRGKPARVTDDTQMMLAVGEAVTGDVTPPWTTGRLESAFIRWSYGDLIGRAPGATCMGSIRRMERTDRWQMSTDMTSKGCGANMRVQPVAYLIDLDPEDRAGVAQLQAALTHAHPTALAAADLTAHALWLLTQGRELAELPRLLLAYCQQERSVYHQKWLGPLWVRSRYATTPRRWITLGWDQMAAQLRKLAKAPRQLRWYQDPCRWTGGGWVAEEALVTGLYCALLHAGEPEMALRRAAATSGDSDSIACLTGSLIGTAWGVGAWPKDWTDRIEYRSDLEMLSDRLS